MKIKSITSMSLDDVKVIAYEYFQDERGYFTEPFRKSDLLDNSEVGSLSGMEIVQVNESASKRGVMRGLHFQWNPFMGKLVRTISGHMVDMFVDIRLGSPNFGKIGMFDMPASDQFGEWIWVPPGFAHGNFFMEDSRIEYLCTGEYSPGCEAGISPLSNDIDWSLCDEACKKLFDQVVSEGLILSEKDRAGVEIEGWANDSRAENFKFGEC